MGFRLFICPFSFCLFQFCLYFHSSFFHIFMNYRVFEGLDTLSPPTSAKELSYLFVTVSGRSYCVVTVLWVPFKPKAQIYLVTEMMRLSIISQVFSPTSRNQSYQLLMFYDHLGMFTFWCPEIYWDKLLLLYFSCRIRPLYENWNTTTAQQNVSITGLRGIVHASYRRR